MSKKIKDLIASLRKPQATSIDLDRALGAAKQAAADAEMEMETASRAYDDGLLDLDTAQLQLLTGRRQVALVEVDRARHLVNSLTTRLAEVRASEEAAAFEAERSAADVKAERVADLVRARYPKLATELVDMMRQITEADTEVAVMNRRLLQRGEQPLKYVQTRALPQPTSPHASAPSIWSGTILQEIKGFAPGYEPPRC